MPKQNFSAKRLAIDKANATMVIAVGVAAFIVVFCLFANKALLEQRSYQAKVMGKKRVALNQLKQNIKAADQLIISYQEFEGASENVLGGNPKGTGDRDGENSRIVLDALPSKYDFPALTTSIEKLVNGNGFSLVSITGTDEEVTQSSNSSSSKPQPVEIPFSIESNIPAQAGNQYMSLFERSIRPIQIQKLTLEGRDSNLTIKIDAKTYFQPEKSLNIRTEVVR